MSKFKDFLEQFDGMSVEVADGSNYAQCVDLAVAWLDWLDLPRTFNHLYAYSIFQSATDGTKANFDLIPNTPDGVPLEGDVVVWGKSYNGTAGHVGIATGEGDTDTFKVFEQNNPVGSVSHVGEHNYNHVIGWLRPKEYLYDEVAQIDDWKKSYFDRFISGLFQRKLLLLEDSYYYQDKEEELLVGIDKLIEDNEAHHRGYEEFKEKYANAEKDLMLKENEIKNIKEQADSDLKKAVADARVECYREFDIEKGLLLEKIEQLNKILKDGVQTIKVPTETPLADRFRGKTLKEKIIGILEILGAK